MPYGIYTASCLVQYISRVLNVVTSMLYPLEYYESLLFSLVGPVVCGCNKTLHRYVCMTIGGDGALNLQSIFRIFVACWIILYHSWMWKSAYTLQSDAMKCFLKVWISLYEFLSIWLPGGTNWYLLSMVIIDFLMILMLCCPWYGTLCWFHGFLNMLSNIWNHLSYLLFVGVFRTEFQ